jgi:hypothetical protein
MVDEDALGLFLSSFPETVNIGGFDWISNEDWDAVQNQSNVTYPSAVNSVTISPYTTVWPCHIRHGANFSPCESWQYTTRRRSYMAI